MALTGAALAADLPSRAPPPVFLPPPPIFTWTGLYIGMNAGYHWGDSENHVHFTGTDSDSGGLGTALADGAANNYEIVASPGNVPAFFENPIPYPAGIDTKSLNE